MSKELWYHQTPLGAAWIQLFIMFHNFGDQGHHGAGEREVGKEEDNKTKSSYKDSTFLFFFYLGLLSCFVNFQSSEKVFPMYSLFLRRYFLITWTLPDYSFLLLYFYFILFSYLFLFIYLFYFIILLFFFHFFKLIFIDLSSSLLHFCLWYPSFH